MGSEGPVVFWKGLKMSRKCLGVSRGCSCGSGGSWSHPEGSGDVPERPWRVQRVLLLIHWGPQIHPEASGDVQEGSCRVQGVSRCAQSILAVIQKGLGMFQRGLGVSGRSLGGFCCLLEGSEDVPGVSWGVQSVLMWVWGVLEPSRRVWGCPREDWEGLGGP